MEKRHLAQAKIWFDGANYVANKDGESDKYAVAVAMAVHAIIKANDALTFKFLHSTARRHDEARRLFEDLIKQNFIKAEYSDYKQIIQEAIDNKVKSEYRGAYFSKADFESLKRKAEKFIKMAGEVVK